MIRAMIAAAAADGEIDDQERANIVSRLNAVGLSEDEREFIERELAAPLGFRRIAAQVDAPELARQVYTASLMAIEVDTQAEKDYLDGLAQALGLPGDEVARIHQRIEAAG
jgi:uncharacterized membrane protein YebE (DUF533 family)